jgi:hypothetical protein
MVRVCHTFHDAEPDFWYYMYATRSTYLLTYSILLENLTGFAEVLEGNYVAFKCFCTHMSVVENNNKELIIIQINNSFMCIIFINAEFDYIKSIL